MNTRIFVRLSYHTDAASLLRLCKQYGDVLGVEVVRDAVGYSSGFAFIEAATPADARAIIAAIDGRVYEAHRLSAELAKS